MTLAIISEDYSSNYIGVAYDLLKYGVQLVLVLFKRIINVLKQLER